MNSLTFHEKPNGQYNEKCSMKMLSVTTEALLHGLATVFEFGDKMKPWTNGLTIECHQLNTKRMCYNVVYTKGRSRRPQNTLHFKFKLEQ